MGSTTKTSVVALVSTLALSGCGSSDKPAAKALTLQRPVKPTAAQCGRGLAAGATRPEAPTPAGTYQYATHGTKALIGERRHARKLPSRTTVVVTPARKLSNIWCYVIQRRYETDLGDTATFLIRGPDVYLRSLRFQSGGYIKTLSPSQPLLTLSGAELDWSGVFRGRTSGRYAAEIIGRKRFKVGARTIRAAGVRTRISYGGEIKGWERSTRWITTNRNLLIAENVTQVRNFGLDRLRLSYTSRLKSLTPG